MPLPFVNETGTIGLIVKAGAENVGGDVTSALLVIFVILIAVCIYFQMWLDVIALVMLPFATATAAYYGGPFMALVVVILIFISWIISRFWFGFR